MNGWIRNISPAGRIITIIAVAFAALSMFAAPALSGHWGGHGGGYGYAYHGQGRYVRPAGYHHGYRYGYGWGGYYRPYGYYYPAVVYAPPPVVYAPPPVVVAPPPPAGISFVFPIRIH